MTAAGDDGRRASSETGLRRPRSAFDLVDRAGSRINRPLVPLVPSVDPRVVFASLAAGCVPDLCDDCIVDIVDGATAEVRIAYPSSMAPAGDLGGLIERAAVTAEHVAQVQFANLAHGPAGDDPRDEAPSLGAIFHGTVSFVWRFRSASRTDRILVGALVEHAVRTVAWQRSEQAAEAATTNAENLQIALHNSRQIGAAIGILMSLHKIDQDRAFDLLRLASQSANRKIRHIAVDVIEAGCLPPAPLPVRTHTGE